MDKRKRKVKFTLVPVEWVKIEERYYFSSVISDSHKVKLFSSRSLLCFLKLKVHGGSH